MKRFRSRFFLTLSSLGFVACQPAPPREAGTAVLPPAAVRLATVTTTTTTTLRRLPGTVQAVARATVATPTTGTVLRADFTLGQRVEADETLVVLDAAALRAQVEQATAALDLATRNHEREAGLRDQGASPAETVRTLAAQQRIAAAQLATAQAQLAYATVRAPFAGTITRRFVEPGDLAAPGIPLFALEGDALEVQVNVPESLPPLSVGSTVTVELDGALAPSRVREVSAAVDPTTRTRLARLTLALNGPAHAGQFARVRWPDISATEIIVPSSAVTTFGQMSQVFVARDGHAQLRLVRVGPSSAATTPIIAGLAPGEHVVLTPPASLRDGQALDVVAP